MSEHHPIQDLMNGTVEKIKSMIDANTVVGTPITTADGTTVIPVSRVTIGFGSGGSDFQSRHSKETTPLSFGGGGGAGVSVTPVCFLVISPTEGTHVLGINAQAVNTADRLVEMIPGAVGKVSSFFAKRMSEDDAADQGTVQEDKKSDPEAP